MIRPLVICWSLVWLAGACLSAQEAPARAAQAPGTSPNVAANANAPPDYVIGPQDVLRVVFWHVDQLSSEVLVRPDGKISLPLLNEIDAAGLTPEQLRARIVDIARRFIEEPTATVIVKEINSRKVFIMGEVAKPGPYALGGPTTILHLIAMAGGLSEFAAAEDIVIVRTVGGHPERFRFNYKTVVAGKDLEQNFGLKTGDTVIVP